MPNISEYPGPIVTNSTSLVGIWMGMTILTFVWQSPKGRLHGNQLNFGAVRRRRQERPLLFALTFDNEFVDHERLNCNNLVTLCTNLVRFRPIISEFTGLKRAIFAATWPPFDHRPSIGILAFRKPIGISQFWFHSSNRQSFLYILYEFGEIRISDLGCKNLYSWRRKFFWGELQLRSLGGEAARHCEDQWLSVFR